MEHELRYKYRKILGGYNFTEEQLEGARYDFDYALEDFNACLNCEGECKTLINKDEKINKKGEVVGIKYINKAKVFFSLHYYDSEEYKRPMFRMFKCPGVWPRKEAVKKRLARPY